MPDLVLAREACYRAIGEAFLNDAVAKQVNFPAWYQSELAELLKVRLSILSGLGVVHGFMHLSPSLAELLLQVYRRAYMQVLELCMLCKAVSKFVMLAEGAVAPALR